MIDHKIDTSNKHFYQHGKPELEERTKARLTQIADMGMEQTGVAAFGLPSVMSGLYIEKIWSYSENDWDEYIEWVQGLINDNK